MRVSDGYDAWHPVCVQLCWVKSGSPPGPGWHFMQPVGNVPKKPPGYVPKVVAVRCGLSGSPASEDPNITGAWTNGTVVKWQLRQSVGPTWNVAWHPEVVHGVRGASKTRAGWHLPHFVLSAWAPLSGTEAGCTNFVIGAKAGAALEWQSWHRVIPAPCGLCAAWQLTHWVPGTEPSLRVWHLEHASVA